MQGRSGRAESLRKSQGPAKGDVFSASCSQALHGMALQAGDNASNIGAADSRHRLMQDPGETQGVSSCLLHVSRRTLAKTWAWPAD